MSKILQAGETGFGILIEQDAGYISPDLNKEIVSEGIKLDTNKPLLVNCVLQKWGVENKNGRVYPKEVLVPQVEEYRKIVDNNSAVSEADHPDSSIISLHNISHKVTKMWWGSGSQEHILFGQIMLIVSRGFIESGIVSVIGDKIVLYLQNGVKLGISSRGVGSLQEINGKNMVQSDFELIGFDLVATPSTPGAYLFPSVDNVEKAVGESYIKKNGVYLKEETKKINDSLDKFLI